MVTGGLWLLRENGHFVAGREISSLPEVAVPRGDDVEEGAVVVDLHHLLLLDHLLLCHLNQWCQNLAAKSVIRQLNCAKRLYLRENGLLAGCEEKEKSRRRGALLEIQSRSAIRQLCLGFSE